MRSKTRLECETGFALGKWSLRLRPPQENLYASRYGLLAPLLPLLRNGYVLGVREYPKLVGSQQGAIGPRISARNHSVCDSTTFATCFGRPSARIWLTGGATFWAKVDEPVGRFRA